MKSPILNNHFAPASPKTGRFSLAKSNDQARTPSSASETGAAGPACDRISKDLRALANWCLLRSVQDHDTQTTLTILSRKVAALKARQHLPEHDPDSHAETSSAREG